MSLILDSNVLLWWYADDSRLRTNGVGERIASTPDVFISLATPWELWIKRAAGKLRLPAEFDRLMEAEEDFRLLTPSLRDVRLAADLPPLHRDPFDRLIIAQALNAGLTVATSDAVFADYGVRVDLV
ncbi:MAG: type II toxin-antitoxin system VapC family toxin [Caulobacter sp.]